MHRIAVVLGLVLVVCEGRPAWARVPEEGKPREVPPDAVEFNGRWFKIFDGKVPWDTARRRCEYLGGRLAVVPDQATWAFLSKLIGNAIVWLGASDAKTEGRWVWVDGTPLTFTAWLPDQPNNKDNEDYLHTWKGGWNDIKQDGRWVDKKTFVGGFVCEWIAKTASPASGGATGQGTIPKREK